MSVHPINNTQAQATDNALGPSNTNFSTFNINMASLNVRGLNDTLKQTNLINESLHNYIDILAIQETHFTSSSCKHIYNRHPNYHALWAHDDKNAFSGVGLLIKHDLARHIQKYDSYKGRILFCDLHFKGSHKFKIINCYIPARHGPFRRHIQHYVTTLLSTAITQNFKIILLGDFNANIDEFNTHIINNRSVNNTKFSLLNFLHSHQFIDTATTFNAFPPPTWNDQSRIDSIFITFPLKLSILRSQTISPKFFRTDHKLFVSTFDRSFFITSVDAAQFRRSNFKRKVFDFEKMTPDKWTMFSNLGDSEFLSNELFFKELPTPPTSSDVNYINDHVSEILLKAAHAVIPTRAVAPPNTTRNNKPLALRNLLKYNRFLQKTIRCLSTKNKSNNVFPSSDRWYASVANLYDIKIDLNISNMEWSSPLTLSNWNDNKHSVYRLYRLVHDQLRSSETKFKFNQIKFFVDKRNNDLRDHERIMINSLMEREHIRIHLDRLMISKDDELFLTVDPDEIKQAATEHFQHCAGVPPPTPSLGDWSEDYSPRKDISSDQSPNEGVGG